MSLFNRLKQGLKKTASGVGDAFRNFAGLPNGRVGEETLEALEEALILADTGVDVASELVESLRTHRFADNATVEDAKKWLADRITAKLAPCEKPLALPEGHPAVVLFVGVNGSGKTTTIGKLAARFKAQEQSVLLAAGDTFRAGAEEQLEIWAKRSGAPLIQAAKDGADPAGVLFQAHEEARRMGANVMLADTAGRLHNRQDLMDELEKITRVLKKQDATAPHAVLLVLDATVGQNALAQVEKFRDIAKVTGLVVTKLDSSAKAGVVVALAEKFGLPLHYIGVGEALEDLQPFVAEDFARALVGIA
jgi:fused signal recognition particle receptor